MRGPYTLRIPVLDEEVPASDLAVERNDCREYNATWLFKSAQHVAARVSHELDCVVEVVGNVGSGSKKERVCASHYSGGRR